MLIDVISHKFLLVIRACFLVYYSYYINSEKFAKFSTTRRFLIVRVFSLLSSNLWVTEPF